MAKVPKSPKPASTRKRARKAGASKRTSKPAGAEAAARAIPSPASAGAAKVRGRFYCQGIGDCHLLRFTKDDGGYFWMLIDCGIHSSITGGTAKIKAIVEDIASQTRRLDVIVLTHEHWDHNSGFLAAQDTFKEFSVGEVWMGWTENPCDPQARQLDKFKQAALNALQQASQRLDGVDVLSPHLSAVKQGLQTVLGFSFGAKGEKVRSAREAAAKLADGRTKYLEPTTAPVNVPELAKSVRIYVLGPPRNAAMLGITERPSEMYGLGPANGWPIAEVLRSAFAVGGGELKPGDDMAAPFDPWEGTDLTQIRSTATDQHSTDIAAFLQNFYDGPELATAKSKSRSTTPDAAELDQSWRRIDHDWLGVSADLAIQLDDRTNNSSVVLAFEFVHTKRVMLFVGDAQVGNWLSWQNLSWTVDGTTVTAPDLLARTVFYKVGHHGSHNATLKQHGLELMVSPDLCGFIPTNEQDAQKVKWGEMPFKPILEDLDRRARHRVVRADDPWIAEATGKPDFVTPSGAIVGLSHDKDTGLWVELDIA